VHEDHHRVESSGYIQGTFYGYNCVVIRPKLVILVYNAKMKGLCMNHVQSK
jgi:hypothetical protein